MKLLMFRKNSVEILLSPLVLFSGRIACAEEILPLTSAPESSEAPPPPALVEAASVVLSCLSCPKEFSPLQLSSGIQERINVRPSIAPVPT